MLNPFLVGRLQQAPRRRGNETARGKPREFLVIGHRLKRENNLPIAEWEREIHKRTLRGCAENEVHKKSDKFFSISKKIFLIRAFFEDA
jgi:hypothetical protein